MYHVLFAQIVHAQREREIEEDIRRRQLLRRQDETEEPVDTVGRRANRSQALSPGVRPTGG